MDYLLLLLGFVFLVKGADFFVTGSSSIAKKFGIPEFIIGLTLVAFGTSAPELAVSLTASLAGQNEIAISNVVGSNIFNIFAVLGFSALILPIKVDKNILSKDLPFSFVAAIVTLFLSADIFLGSENTNVITRGDGLTLLVLFCVFLYYTITYALNNKEAVESEEIESLPIYKSVFLIFVGLAGVVMGGNFVVDSATNIALSFNVSETIIGLTIVALGTSLPEFVTTVIATKKGNADMALGNVVGSNIFNLLLILGLTATIDPITVVSVNLYDLVVLIVLTLVVILMSASSKKIDRKEGIILILGLVAYYIFIFVR
ncbi:MAG: calcium/sodium antiporter [Lachnospirales bacterium]